MAERWNVYILMRVTREKPEKVQPIITKSVYLALVTAFFTSCWGHIHNVGFYAHLVCICSRIKDILSAIINVTIPSSVSDFIPSVLKQGTSCLKMRALFQHWGNTNSRVTLGCLPPALPAVPPASCTVFTLHLPDNRCDFWRVHASFSPGNGLIESEKCKDRSVIKTSWAGFLLGIGKSYQGREEKRWTRVGRSSRGSQAKWGERANTRQIKEVSRRGNEHSFLFTMSSLTTWPGLSRGLVLGPEPRGGLHKWLREWTYTWAPHITINHLRSLWSYLKKEKKEKKEVEWGLREGENFRVEKWWEMLILCCRIFFLLFKDFI